MSPGNAPLPEPERSAVTGLPGSRRLDELLEQRLVRPTAAVALVRAELDGFKPFNDRYGFERGDRLVRFTGDVLSEAVDRLGGHDGVTVHLGGDEFAVITTPARADAMCRLVVDRFDEGVASLYDPEDAARGWIQVTDRLGRPQRHELVSISLGVASTARRRLGSRQEAVSTAARLLRQAKRLPGSAYCVDRAARG